MKKKLWISSMLLALITSAAIFFVMLQIEISALRNYEKETIYVACKEIPKGVVLQKDNQEEYLQAIEMDKSIVPAKALRNWEQVDGLTVKTDIDAGAVLTQGMFLKMQTILKEIPSPVIAGCKADDLYQVVGGVLRGGDYINIYTVSETGNADKVWEAVYVQQVFDGNGNLIAENDKTSPAKRMNVYLDEGDVERFYTELARGTLRVVKVCE